MQALRDAVSRLRLVLGLLLAITAAMASAGCAEPHYISNTNLAMALLAPPPEATSSEQRADLTAVQLAHQDRSLISPVDIESERHVTVFTFAPVIGSFFETNRFPKAERFFRRVLQDTDMAVEAGKDHWDRPRPYIVDTNLLEGLPERFTGSYPSGHSTLATVFASLLADVFPEKRDAILAKGREIGWHRVVLGRHYPTDIYAGRVLGQRIVRELKQNHDFRRDFREARLEIRSWISRNQLQ